MKNLTTSILAFLIVFISLGQSSAIHKDVRVTQNAIVGESLTVGSKSSETSAGLILNATDKGFLIEAINTTQRDAIVLPTHGLIIHNLTTDQYEQNTGTSGVPVWTAFGGETTEVDPVFTASAATNVVDNLASNVFLAGDGTYQSAGADGNGIYDGSGNVPVATIVSTLDTKGLILKGVDDLSASNFITGRNNSSTEIFSVSNKGTISNDYQAGSVMLSLKASGTTRLLLDASGVMTQTVSFGNNTDAFILRNSGAVNVFTLTGNGTLEQRSGATIVNQISPAFDTYFNNGNNFIVGGSVALGSEDISLQGETRIGGDAQIDGLATIVTTGKMLSLESSSTSAYVDIKSAGNSKMQLGHLAGSNYLWNGAGEGLTFYTNAAVKGTWYSNGNFKVGTSGSDTGDAIQAIGSFHTNVGYKVGATTGINETLTFGGGTSGEVLTITVTGGIITSRTLVP